jgi:hypothetical protein
MTVYPAYARQIAMLAARGIRPVAVGVLLSSRWWYFDHVAKVCIKPDEWALRRWEFGYLRGMHVVAVQGDDCDERQLGELLADLMWAGPRVLWVCDLWGHWIARDIEPHLLGRQVAEWVDPKLGAFVKAAASRYAQAQLAALELENKELSRAIALGRDAVPALKQRQQALAMVDSLFGGSGAAGDARAA